MKKIRIYGTILSINLLFFPIMISLYLLGYGKEMVILISIIFIHELSHGIVAMILGIKIREIQLLPFGGVIKLDKNLSFTLGEEIFISAAGPISNMVLSATVFFLKESLGWRNNDLDFVFLSSLSIGVFNLIPALPLDGGRILRSLLSFFLSYKKATKIVVGFSIFMGVFLIVFNIYIFSLENYNFALGLVGLLIIYQSLREQRMAIYATMRDIAAKKENLNKSGSMESQHITVLPQTTLGTIFKQFTPKKFHIVYVLDQEYALKGILTEDEILSAILSYGMHAKVKIILEKKREY